ncbi:neuroligin-4, X-linked-like [Leptopilina boulardi]|uniref:neuroligin-4, X-linked-like n=1 Tax=Leptopilina boulardi TaxID=63433 RepID=UPI0021F680B8|nr:neuroligin-4, X-linked-like [Leptopilina boulardi]
MLERCQPAAWTWPPLDQRILRMRCNSLVYSLGKIGFLLLATIISSTHTTRYASRIVETRSGQIRGVLQELNSQYLDPVEVFRGIPYAAPPAGTLRMKPPMPPIPWAGIKLADTFGAVCPQKLPDISNMSIALTHMPKSRYTQLQRFYTLLTNQSEDCLFLNLYIPGSGSRGVDAPYAVIMYVHGESFEWGSGNFYDGSVLASAGHVIVITLNYRLGILGFLRTASYPDVVSSSGGNLALRDIAMGLRWVRDNIAAFGGDPTRITLIGHDTGAALANYLLLAPFGKGLFHRIVLLSGSALSPWASIHNPNDLHIKISQQLNCTSEDDDIADCIREADLTTLLNLELPEIRFVPQIGPIIPIDQSNPDPGLDMERASDAFIEVPLMLGVSTAESYLDFNTEDIQYGFEEDQRNRILRTFIRNTYYYHLNEIFSSVKNEYTDWDKPILHPINIRDSTMEALSDGHTVAPLMRIAFYHARRGAKTYFFHFNYQTKDSDYPQRLGSARGEDIPYIFGLPLVSGGRFFPHNYTKQDQSVGEAMLTFITNFAKTSNPNLPHNIESVDYGNAREKTRFRGLLWEEYDTNNQQYLMIAQKPKMKSHYRGHKMALWLNLIPQLHQPGDEDVSMRHHHFREKGDQYYAGAVRDEWYIPPPLPETSKSVTYPTILCSSSLEDLVTDDPSDVLDDNEDDAELLQRLASRHYYSTTTALAITVGVGCILLVLNMLIFAGIYYQRDRDKKRAAMHCCPNNQEAVPMSSRGETSREEPKTGPEPPPLYTTLTRSSSSGIPKEQRSPSDPERPGSKTGQKDLTPPKPPARTTSSLSSTSGTIKKRVQIQEISV